MIFSGFGDEISPNLDVQMAVMRDLGIGHIELRGVDGRNISEFGAQEARVLARRLEEGGMRVSALGSPIGKTDIAEPFSADTLLRMLEAARILGARYIRLFSFYVPAGQADAHQGEVMERMRRMKEAARGSGVMLLHENECGIYGDTIARCRQLAALCDGDFGLIFDPSNFVQTGEDAWQAWLALRDHVVYMHMKDSVRDMRKAGRDLGFQNVSDHHRLVGRGDGHVQRIVNDLKNRGYQGFLSLEPHLVNCDLVPGTPEQKWRQAAGALKELVEKAG